MSDKGATHPMAAVGEYETVLPFQAVGAKPHVVRGESVEELEGILLGLAREKYAVVFVQESLYMEVLTYIEDLNGEYETSFIPIPGLRGSMGIGLNSIRSSVERAVGMDIFAAK